MFFGAIGRHGAFVERGEKAQKRLVLPVCASHGAARRLGKKPKRIRPVSIYRDRDEDRVEPLLITARKAAALLCISVRYLYTLTKGGQIRVVPVGRKRLYRIADIQRFIDDRTAGPAPAGS